MAKKQNRTKQFKVSLPLLIGVLGGLIPLVVRMHTHHLEPVYQDIFFKANHYDLFSYYKAMVLIIGTAIIGLTMLFQFKKEKTKYKKNKIIDVSFAGMLFFVWLSTLLSEYKLTALFGFVDRYEGAFVWTAYLILSYITYQVIRTKEDALTILKGIAVGAFFVFTLGALQLVGLDYMRFPITKYLLVPLSVVDQVTELAITIQDMIYSTLYNPNFVASYAALLLPLSIYFAWTNFKRKSLLFYGVLLLLNLINLVGCFSSSGYVAVIMMAFVTFITLLIGVITNYKSISKIGIFKFLTAFVLIFIVVTITFKIPQVQWEFERAKVTVKNLTQQTPTVIESINVERDLAVIKVLGRSVSVSLKSGSIEFFIDDEPIQFEKVADSETQMALNTAPVRVSLVLNSNAEFFILNVEDRQIPIGYHNGALSIINQGNRPIELVNPPVFKPLIGRESLGSGRGLIWGRAIPLLSDTLIIGRGADTIPFYYPQNDWVGKFKFSLLPYFYVDKPHSSLIQMTFQFGILYLASFFTIIFYTLKKLNLFTNMRRVDYSIYFSLSMMILGYLTTGVFNDSIINVAPVFWIILGVAMSFATTDTTV